MATITTNSSNSVRTPSKSVTRETVLTHVLNEADFLNSDEREVIERMLASITKPRKKNDEPTKAQLINASLADALIAKMRAYGEPVTAKWICDNVNGIQSPQKAVAVVKAAGNTIARFYEGRQAYYRLID